MRAIAVDDEFYMLEALTEAVSASDDIESVRSFSSCSEALGYVEENPIDVAFLDINMRGIGGLKLAERITENQPKCKTAWENKSCRSDCVDGLKGKGKGLP